jgi:HEAT repeat protein
MMLSDSFSDADFSDYDPQACLDTLKNPDQPMDARMKALFQMMTGNSVDALMALLPLFEADSGLALEVREAIAVVLGEWASESATDALLRCYENEAEAKSLRVVALEALGKTQHAKALDCLMKALQQEDNDFFGTAAEALKHFGADALPELCLMLKDGQADVQCIAAWHLGKLKNTMAIPHLVQALQVDSPVDVLALCAWALGQIGEARSEVLTVLQAHCHHPVADIAQRAQDALVKVRRNLN